MEKTTALDSVGGEFVDDDVLHGIVGTLIEAKDMNALQNEICNVIDNAGLTQSDTDNTQLWQGINIASGLSTLRNKIMNGDFRLWQRRTTSDIAESSEAYAADRWRVARDSWAGSGTVTRQGFGTAENSIPSLPEYYLQYNVVTAGRAELVQSIEDVRTFAGVEKTRYVTLSYYAKATAAGKYMSCAVTQKFGTGGSPSANVDLHIEKHALTTSWAKYTHTFQVPAITGKTIGTDGAHTSSLDLRFFFSDSTGAPSDGLGAQSGTFGIACVQMESGQYATSFEQIPFSLLLTLCGRYYEKHVDYNIVLQNGTFYYVIGTTYTSGIIYVNIPLTVSKRILPNIIFYGVVGTGLPELLAAGGNYGTASSITLTGRQNNKSISIFINGSGWTAGQSCNVGIGYSADADF